MVELVFFLIAFLSDVVGTMAGFGSSTVFLPFALLFVDFNTALILVGVSHLFGNLGRIAFFRRGLDWKLLREFGLASLLFAVLGASLTALVSPDALKLVLGVFIFAFSTASLAERLPGLPARGATAVAGGAASGFFAGLIGTGGALRGTFLAAFRLPKEKYIATAAAIAIATDLTRIPIYLAANGLAWRYVLYVPVLLFTALGGSYVGKRIVDRVPQRAFRVVVLLALLLVSLKFIYDGVVHYRAL